MLGGMGKLLEFNFQQTVSNFRLHGRSLKIPLLQIALYVLPIDFLRIGWERERDGTATGTATRARARARARASKREKGTPIPTIPS